MAGRTQGARSVKVRSPLLDIMQTACALKHDVQVGGDAQAAGNAWHEEPGGESRPMTPPMVTSQYVVPCGQNADVHGKVPDGGVQPPEAERSCPARAASQGLEYTWPSQAHAGFTSVVQPVGRGLHVPSIVFVPQSSGPKSQ